ncbi:DUF3302 domain-containing protein [Aliamphritea hakodatensis]|uniref:DUF3302 domain-containing protein n=1 Tax=Aliamphritea hakodatensis TaxID=2895352 RepID=UPI0022FD4769|nr:DUF3302 domain-containing protein [Aliamphritea hakodatensis]
MFLDYAALFLIFFVGIFVFYAVIVIHDIPYEIAVHRNHPHQDAIHVAGWVSLFTLHILWPFLWIWSTLYREDRGWGFKHSQHQEQTAEHADLASIQQQLTELQEQLSHLKDQQER